MSDLHHHVRSAARAAGVPEPPRAHLDALAHHPLVRRFEELLVAPGSAAHIEGDDLLRTVAVTLIGGIDQAEAADLKAGRQLSPLAKGVRAALQGELRKHAQPTGQPASQQSGTP
jgi:hypothetical protein